MSDRRGALLAAGLTFAALLPFLGKAFTIDDPLFLRLAEQIARDPLHPYAFEILWSSSDPVRPEPAATVLANPPLWGYLLAPVVALTGAPEWAIHLTMACWAAVAAWGMWRLAQAAGVSAPWATLLFVTTPCFYVLATTAMPDVPAAALALHGAAFVVDAARRGRRVHWSATPLLVAACLCRYNAAAAALALAALAVTSSRARWSFVLPALAAVAAIAVTNLSIGLEGGALARYAQLRLNAALAGRVVATLTQLGFLAAVLAACAALVHRPELSWPVLVGLAVLGSVVTWATPGLPFAGPPLAVGLVATVGGLVVLSVAAALPRAERADAAFVLWLAAALAVPILYTHVAAKYFIMAMPPLIVLLLRGADLAPARRGLIGATGVAIVLAVTTALADAHFADVYRTFATRGASVERGAGGRVYFAGHWGWQWYMERAGAVAFEPARHRLGPEDLLVTIEVADPQVAGGWAARSFEPVVGWAPGDWLPVRVMDSRSGAGFHSQGWGLLPVSLATTPLERFAVWRARPRPQ
jgi:hypothetical protein